MSQDATTELIFGVNLKDPSVSLFQSWVYRPPSITGSMLTSRQPTSAYLCSRTRPSLHSEPSHLPFLAFFLPVIQECQILRCLRTDVKMITLPQFPCAFNTERRQWYWVGDEEGHKPMALLSGSSPRNSQFLENEALGSNYGPHPSLASTNCILIDQLVSTQ